MKKLEFTFDHSQDDVKQAILLNGKPIFRGKKDEMNIRIPDEAIKFADDLPQRIQFDEISKMIYQRSNSPLAAAKFAAHVGMVMVQQSCEFRTRLFFAAQGKDISEIIEESYQTATEKTEDLWAPLHAMIILGAMLMMAHMMREHGHI